MNNDNWITEEQEPWEQSFYRTGSTRPPKSHRGILAILLVSVIFLGGVATAFSLLNIRLFRTSPEPVPEDASFRFSNEEQTPASVQAPEDITVPISAETNIQLQLNQTPASVENIPQEGGLSLQEIYSKSIASVVSITCTTPSGSSTGSGVVLSENGYLVTNSHVIDGAQSLQVLFHDGKTLPARIVGADEFSDLAVLRVDANNLTPAEFGSDTALRVGDSVVAIGDPLGIELRGTMTNGIVSAINRDISTGGRTMTLIQTNAALNSGNSGGPLINCYGQVIGINTMKIGDNMSTAGVEGLGFAIPSTTVKEIVDQLLRQGYVSGRPWLGISVQQLSSFDQLYYRLPSGLYITEVAANTDADAKGLVPGDILLSIDDQRVTTAEALQQLLYNHNAGDQVTVVIYRSGTQYQLELTLSEAK
jgi:serine protease Do